MNWFEWWDKLDRDGVLTSTLVGLAVFGPVIIWVATSIWWLFSFTIPVSVLVVIVTWRLATRSDRRRGFNNWERRT